MTPQREVYLAKIGELERGLRESIVVLKKDIKLLKACLNPKYNMDIKLIKIKLKYKQISLGVNRHELNRLKGFDNVVMPKYCSIRTFEDNEAYAAGFVYKEGECGKCG